MKTGRGAAAQMARWHASNKSGVKGMCLKTCRQAWGIAAKYPSAISAWNNTRNSDKNLCATEAPTGYPHFWKGGKYGHVCLQSDKVGYVWSTDLPTRNRIGLIHIDVVNKKWGYKYLGWTKTLNGQRLK